MPRFRRARALAFRTNRSIFGHAIVLLACVGSAWAETPRERCSALTATGARPAAIAACDEAVAMRGTAQDLWAAAEVRVGRAEAPTMDDLIRADLYAAAAKRMAPSEPWGDLARFDLARRWGDPALTAERLEALVHTAPTDPRTLAAAALVRGGSASQIAGWLALLGALFALAFAMRRRPKRFAAALVLLFTVRASAAAPAPAFPVDDADPERAVPTLEQANARPLDFAYFLQELGARAEAAAKRNDRAAQVRYLRALARAVPDSSLPQQQLCDALVEQGKPDEALPACRAALGLPGVRAQDFVRFGALVLSKKSPTAQELDDADAAARHLTEQPSTRALGEALLQKLDARKRTRHVTLAVGLAGLVIGAWLLLRRRRS
jgi:hypothetical protein